jgi:hypothetical protein
VVVVEGEISVVEVYVLAPSGIAEVEGPAAPNGLNPDSPPTAQSCCSNDRSPASRWRCRSRFAGYEVLNPDISIGTPLSGAMT